LLTIFRCSVPACCVRNRRIKYEVIAAIVQRPRTPPTTPPAITALFSAKDEVYMVVGPFVEVENEGG
jgi:hypothetical protein